MAQNIYDLPTFFTEYSKLPRSQGGLSNAPEWPFLRTMLGQSVSNARVLDLGCGFGWFCRWARDEGGAASVHGIDVSENMLRRAKEWPSSESDGKAIITYEIGDLETIQLPPEAYDVAYSSLAFHYIPDLVRLIREIRGTLALGGRFVFSIEHPIFTAQVQARTPARWHADPANSEKFSWLLNSYADEGERLTDWLANGVRKYHRTVESYVSTLLENGFAVTGFKEYFPSLEYLNEHPEWHKERERPLFLLIAAETVS
jgi:SAM-dependent methyltransferase